ncbi:SRPBCC family protein [Parasphingorhabdus pacifica]
MQHQFTVPAPVDVAWSALLDPERVAPCMPGATLTKAEGNDFAGSVKVRLGPISLLYKGNGSFSEIDSENHQVVIDASGKDSRGNGTAAATVTAVLTEHGERTSVTVDTDLKVTGKPAQLGRGLISEVGGKIIDQFAECLAGRLSVTQESASQESASQESATQEPASQESASQESAPRESTAAESAAAGTGAAARAADGDREPDTAAGRGNGGPAAAPGTSGRRRGERPVGRPPAWRVTPPSEESAATGTSTAAQEHASNRADAVVTGKTMPSDEAIDLLGTAGTPVLKRIVPVAGAIVVVVLLLRMLRRRRR